MINDDFLACERLVCVCANGESFLTVMVSSGTSNHPLDTGACWCEESQYVQTICPQKNGPVLSLKRRENAVDRYRYNLIMAKRVHLAFGFILLFCLLRTTRTFSGHEEGEYVKFLRRVKLIWHPSFEVSLVY